MSRARDSSVPYSLDAMHVYTPSSSLEVGDMISVPVGNIRLWPPDPIRLPSFFHWNLGRGAASGSQTIVVFPLYVA